MDENVKPEKERIEHYSNSSASTFRRCKYKYQLLYGKGKVELPQEEGNGLRLGSAGHMAMRAFYSGEKPSVAFDWAYEEFDPQTEAEYKKFEELKAVLRKYFPLAYMDGWEILEVEKKIELDRYQGIFDLVVRTKQGKIWIVDHKFRKSRQMSHLEVDTQVSFYLMLAKLIGVEVEGLLYNTIPMDGKGDGEPIRRLCFRTPWYLENFKRDLDAQILEMDAFYGNPNPYRNQTGDCSWDCTLYNYCLKQLGAKPK